MKSLQLADMVYRDSIVIWVVTTNFSDVGSNPVLDAQEKFVSLPHNMAIQLWSNGYLGTAENMSLRFGALNDYMKNLSMLSKRVWNGVGMNQARWPREAIVKSDEHHGKGYQTKNPNFTFDLDLQLNFKQSLKTTMVADFRK